MSAEFAGCPDAHATAERWRRVFEILLAAAGADAEAASPPPPSPPPTPKGVCE